MQRVAGTDTLCNPYVRKTHSRPASHLQGKLRIHAMYYRRTNAILTLATVRKVSSHQPRRFLASPTRSNANAALGLAIEDSTHPDVHHSIP